MFDLALLISEKVALTMAVVVLISIWDLVWRAFGLWKSARNKQVIWFVALLIFSTAGILPIVYIYFFQKKVKPKKKKKR